VSALKLALPTGDARATVFELLGQAGIAATGYESGSRLMRSMVEQEGFALRIFRERDIPVQVALGNYDLGICSDAWLTEVQVRFPLQRLVRVGSLPGAMTEVWLAASPESGLRPGQVPAAGALAGARIVSELPNLADHWAMQARIPGYRLIPLAGSADAYPPEDAEIVVAPVAGPAVLEQRGLVPLARVHRGGLALIANADALVTRPMATVLSRLAPLFTGEAPSFTVPPADRGAKLVRTGRRTDVVRLAVPDGHAQRHAPGVLRAAGIMLDGYDETAYVRRPATSVDGLTAKVLRPQDMPQLIAMGMFDIGISGRDLLYEHLAKFPSSPVEMAVDLGTNRYRIGPVVDQAFPADTTAEAIAIWNNLGRPVRIASEFPATAERFALDHHLRYTTIIPVAGASEGFVPEDADFLVEGTETGTSIRANGLKMLDPFMESTSCVIVRREPATSRLDILEEVVARLRATVGVAAAGG
jgi:ATP phosphoribosyltransferase